MVGAAAHSASVTGNPVLVGGSDGINVYRVLTDTSGRVQIGTPQLPAALVGGRLDENIGAWFGSTAPTVGQKAMVASIPVVMASDQTPVQVVVNAVSPSAITGIVSGSSQLGGGSAGTLNAVRATTYNEPSANAQRSVASSSASDSAAGVGARTITLTYHDATGAGPFTETITLNGTTPVNTVATNICFIEKILVATVGSTRRNVGVITLFAGTGGGGGTVGTLGVGNLVTSQGDNRTLWAHHYVPTGKTSSLATYIISAESGGSGTNATFFLRSVSLPIGDNAEVVISDILLVVGPLVRQLAIPIKIIGPARVTAYGVPGGNNVKLNASFDFSELPT
jgi:hypothetical protein